MSYNYNKVYNYSTNLNKIATYLKQKASVICISVAYDLKYKVIGDEFYKADLPIPTAIIEFNWGYILIYKIIEQAKTNTAKTMLDDIKKRFVITLQKRTNAIKVQISNPYFLFKNLDNKLNYFTSDNIYGMRYLSNFLESNINIQKDEIKFNDKIYKELAKQTTDPKEIKILEKLSDDAIFDTLRELAYRFYSANGYINEEVLYQLGLSANIPEKTHKGRVLEYKSRAIVDWINKNYNKKKNFTEYKRKLNDEELKMTRQELAKQTHKLRKINSKAKVEKAIEKLKIKELKVSVRNIAKEAGISTTTAQKYLKELRENNLI